MLSFETKLWIIVVGIILHFILLSNGAIIMNNKQMMRDRNGELVEAGSVKTNNLRTGLVGKLKKKPTQESLKDNHNHGNNGGKLRNGYDFEPPNKNQNYHSYSHYNDPDPTIVYLNTVPTPIPEIEYQSKPYKPSKPSKKPNYMSFLVTKDNQNQYTNTPPPSIIMHDNLEPTKAYLTNDLVNPDYLNYMVTKEERPNYFPNPSVSPQYPASSQTPPWIKPEFYQPPSLRPTFSVITSTSVPIIHYPSIPSTPSTPFYSSPSPTIMYNDDLTSKENFLNQTYDELIKYDHPPNSNKSPYPNQNPVFQNSQQLPNTHQYLQQNEQTQLPNVQNTLEQPNVVVIYASPTPDYMHYQQQNHQISAPDTSKKKTSKNKSKKNSTITQEHEFMQNLEFFKKYFTFNCSISDSKGKIKEMTKEAVPQEKIGPYKITNKLPPTTGKPPKVKASKKPQTVKITPKPRIRTKEYPDYYYKRKTQKPQKVVYVEQIPGVEEVENIFEGVYDLVENAFTSKEIIEMRNKPGSNITALDSLLHKKRQAKSPKSKSLDDSSYFTKKNKMDTTKEYDHYRIHTTPQSPPRITRADEEKKSSESEEEPEYYFDRFNLGFNLGKPIDEDDQEDDDSGSDEKEYSEESEETETNDTKMHQMNSETPQDKVIPIRIQPPRAERLEDDSYENYSDEESAEKQAGVIDKVKGLFSRGIFATIGNFLNDLTGNSRVQDQEDNSEEEEYEEVTARATTPRGSEKVSKRPKRANPTRNPWNFFQDSNFFETDSQKLETMPSASDLSTNALFLNPFDSLNWNFFGERDTVPRKSKKPNGKSIDYSNNQLWRLNVTTADQITSLEEFQITPESKGIQWWRGPNLKENNDVLVSPNKIAAFHEFLDDEDITYEILNRNIQNAVQYENHELTLAEREEMTKKNGHPFSWFKYHDFDEIQKFQEMMQRKFPQNVEVLHIGTSYEGRPLTIIKITSNDEIRSTQKKKARSPRKRKGQSVKSAIFIESGSEGRDWIGPAVSTWMLDAVTKGILRNDTLGETMRSMDWYIMPVLNPDGYDYSHKFDRFWKKTRSANNEQPLGLLATAWDWFRKSSDPKKEKAREICYGVDPEKNFRDDEWAETGTADGCSDDYSGKFAFSEPETKALGKFLLKNRKQIRIFLSLKPYGQSISYSRAGSSKNQYDDLMDMAIVARETLKDVGMAEYTVKNMEQPPGSSRSFASHQGIKYSFQLSLKDSATNGFILPASHIDMTAKECFEMVRGMIDYM